MPQVRELVWDAQATHAAELRSLTSPDLIVHNYPLGRPSPAHVRVMDRIAALRRVEQLTLGRLQAMHLRVQVRFHWKRGGR